MKIEGLDSFDFKDNLKTQFNNFYIKIKKAYFQILAIPVSEKNKADLSLESCTPLGNLKPSAKTSNFLEEMVYLRILKSHDRKLNYPDLE